MTIPTPTILTLTVRDDAKDFARSSASGNPVAFSDQSAKVLALFSGLTLTASVYSETNICFTFTEEEARQAFNKLDCWYVTKDDLEMIINRFCGKCVKPLAMMLPNLYIQETPAEIKELLAA